MAALLDCKFLIKSMFVIFPFKLVLTGNVLKHGPTTLSTPSIGKLLQLTTSPKQISGEPESKHISLLQAACNKLKVVTDELLHALQTSVKLELGMWEVDRLIIGFPLTREEGDVNKVGVRPFR